jgi:hypothetical protein
MLEKRPTNLPEVHRQEKHRVGMAVGVREIRGATVDGGAGPSDKGANSY